MSWMYRLSEVYENNEQQVGLFERRGNGQKFTLLPISHITQSAQIQITLDREGNFYRAEVVPKNEARTIVPATPDSANRAGSKKAAHFLHDKLFYVAGDYMKYGGEEKRSDNFSYYIKQMKDWSESSDSHHKVHLIYQYVQKGTVIEDLIKAKVLFVDHNDQLIEKWTVKEDELYGIEKPEIYKVVTGQSSDALVRFTILSERADDPLVWEDRVLYEQFRSYLANTVEEKMTLGVCYVLGEEKRLTEQHGSRLRNAGDMSKLISSNDSKGFTYRGRFSLSNEAVQVSYEASQKAHNALRWLIQKQDFRSDTRHFITFGVQNPAVVHTFNGTVDMYSQLMEQELGTKTTEETDVLNQVMAEQVQQALRGKKYFFDSDKRHQIIVTAVDAATTGRLSIVYFQELDSKLYLDRLAHWHETCRWIQVYFSNDQKKTIHFIGTPSTYQIVEAIYGPKADEKVKKELYTRLLPCIVDQMPIPKDIVRAIFNRVKNPASFGKNTSSPTSEWRRTLNIACALIYKQFEKEERTMTLDLECKERDYLFGRLLGVAEVFERNELARRQDDRATNAIRYFNAFTQRPARTWMTIRKQLHPYQVREGEKVRYYNRLIRDIEASFQPNEMNNDSLNPLFLLGYSSQVQELYTKKEKKEENEHVSNPE